MDEFIVDYNQAKSEIITCRSCSNYTYLVTAVSRGLVYSKCKKCNNYLICSSVAQKEDTKSYNLSYNSSVRYFDNHVELVYYKSTKKLPIKDKEYLNNIKDVDHSRLLRKSNDGVFEVCKDCFTYEKFYRSIKNSRKRALQNFYSFALANNWEYFFTLTFDSRYVDRYDDISTTSLFKEFERYVKRNNSNAKILAVPEYHEKVNEDGKRALHFHGFLSNAPNLTFKPCYTSNGEAIFTNFETDGKKVPRLSCIDWKYGFNTFDLIVNPNSFRIANYCMKYIKKNDSVGYQAHTFYHTRNLNKCYSDLLFIPNDNLDDVANSYNLKVYKETDDLIVLRSEDFV